jgi:hypothetical protein
MEQAIRLRGQAGGSALANSSPGILKPSIVAVLKGLAPDIDLKHDTGKWVGGIRCPFHGFDRNGSAAYNSTLERFRCHACSIAGDGYDVIQAVEGCDLGTARARATELAGMTFQSSATSSSASAGASSRLTGRKTSARRKLVRDRYGKKAS